MSVGLSLDRVSYSYGARKALEDVSFTVGKGEFCALLGPNGAGKSTLFGLITGLFSMQAGRILVGPHDIASEPRAALGRMGVVFQQPTIDLDLTVRRNLLYFAALHGIAGREAGMRADAALERLGMIKRSGELARTLNGGHRRRMEIARALIHRPEVLLLDEPTVGLDAPARAAITGHVHDLALDGLTVLWATHLTDEVRPDDRIVVLHLGQVLAYGTARSLCAGQSVGDYFLGLVGEAAA